jgi:hypothetical protein
MNRWTPSGAFAVHVFHMNNELAGYCSVLHAMTLIGSSGHYGRPLTAVVVGFGNTARGAITALQAMGISDITALTMRDVPAVASPMPAAALKHLYRTEVDSTGTTVQTLEAGCPPPSSRRPRLCQHVARTRRGDVRRLRNWQVPAGQSSMCPATRVWASIRPAPVSPPARSGKVSSTGVDHSPSLPGTVQPGLSAALLPSDSDIRPPGIETAPFGRD